jgi:hypothetical protein
VSDIFAYPFLGIADEPFGACAAGHSSVILASLSDTGYSIAVSDSEVKQYPVLKGK